MHTNISRSTERELSLEDTSFKLGTKKIKRKVPVLYPNKLNLGIGETCYKPVGFMHFYSYSYAFVKSMTKTVSALLLTVCHH